jgi:cytochrome c oxidase subunit 4
MVMSTEHATDVTETELAHDADDHGDTHGHGHGLTDMGYVKVALVLAALTGLEVALTYMHIGALFMPLLLLLMVIKFVTVVSFFMHLRFDNRIFSWLFYSGLFLALGVYLAALCTFQFFAGN